MNKTDSILDELASQGALPAAGHSLRFITPLLVALVVCAGATIAVLDDAFPGIATTGAGPILTKWGFSLALVLMAPIALWALGRPGRRTNLSVAILSVPFVLVLGLLAMDLSINSQTSFPGETWQRCLTAMALLSPLAFGGAIIAMRALAPTNLRRAGLVAGLFGGGVAMTAYAPFCPERGMLYMAVFYCLPILIMAGIGWLAGPKLLRW
ncbi:DUF1109 domain-containing protein [Aurantiacibacter marinus]|uniref:DUF1109 domain-containing protein n=1 Tax=Aurantiacibacter marinus TaxID=874156 RepID=UPI00069BF4C4|nr:DUF1109 domain-containing protein [Aurantiacibacter marinus]